jgi:hypothetical protein
VPRTTSHSHADRSAARGKTAGAARRGKPRPPAAQQGQARRGTDLLAPVYRWFTSGFDTPDLRVAKALLDEP